MPGVLHDHCSAMHPMAVGSPFLRSLELERHGLEWLWPEVDLAHPLDDGSAGVMVRSIADTAAGLGADGPAWQRVFQPSERFGGLVDDLLQPVIHLPRHPLSLVRFGLPALAPATLLARPLLHAPGAGAVRRRGGARVQPAVAAAELLGGNGADLRLPRVRLGAPPRRLALRSPTPSHRCWASTAARSRPAGRCARWPSCPPPTR